MNPIWILICKTLVSYWKIRVLYLLLDNQFLGNNENYLPANVVKWNLLQMIIFLVKPLTLHTSFCYWNFTLQSFTIWQWKLPKRIRVHSRLQYSLLIMMEGIGSDPIKPKFSFLLIIATSNNCNILLYLCTKYAKFTE